MAENNILNTNTEGTDEETTETVNTNQPAEGVVPPSPASGTTQEPSEPPANDWLAIRERVAGSDEKLLKQLSRYTTLEDALKGGVEARNKLGGMKALQPLTDKSTPEEVAEYRKAYGIPENPEGYAIDLPDGLVLGDADKPVADRVIAVAHKHNVPPAAVNAIIAEHLTAQEEILGEQIAKQQQAYKESLQFLKSDDGWGREFDSRVNSIKNFLAATAPEGTPELLMGAQLADGTPLANHVPSLMWLANLAGEFNPMPVLPGINESTPTASIEEEVAKLRKMMGDKNSDYWKGPLAQANQDRMYKLGEVLAERQKRGA